MAAAATDNAHVGAHERQIQREVYTGVYSHALMAIAAAGHLLARALAASQDEELERGDTLSHTRHVHITEDACPVRMP